MSTLSAQLKSRLQDSGSLMSALDALTNLRAFAVLAATALTVGIVGALLFGLSGYLTVHVGSIGMAMMFVSGLVCWALALIGINAAGILLMDEAQGVAPRTVTDAVVLSLLSSHRLVAVVLLNIVLFVIYLLALALVLFLCKIPGIGPVLYAFVFPVGVVLTALVIFGLLYVAMPLAAPAIWNGKSILETVAMLGLVAQKRLVYVVIMEVLLGLLAAIVTGFIALVLGSGVSTMLGMSAAIVGVGGGGFSPEYMLQNAMGGGGGSGYIYAMAIGTALLLLAAAIAPMLVLLKGSALIYLNATNDLPIAHAREKLTGALNDVKARAEEVRARATEASKTSVTAPPQAAPSVPTPEPTPSSSSLALGANCPVCRAPISANDVFCGECGHKLK